MQNIKLALVAALILCIICLAAFPQSTAVSFGDEFGMSGEESPRDKGTATLSDGIHMPVLACVTQPSHKRHGIGALLIAALLFTLMVLRGLRRVCNFKSFCFDHIFFVCNFINHPHQAPPAYC